MREGLWIWDMGLWDLAKALVDCFAHGHGSGDSGQDGPAIKNSYLRATWLLHETLGRYPDRQQGLSRGCTRALKRSIASRGGKRRPRIWTSQTLRAYK